MCRLGIYIWGEGKKYYVVTKHVKKKIHFCLVGDFPMTYQIKGVDGLGIYSDSSVDSFYYAIVLVTEPWMLYWLLNV